MYRQVNNSDLTKFDDFQDKAALRTQNSIELPALFDSTKTLPEVSQPNCKVSRKLALSAEVLPSVQYFAILGPVKPG